MLSNKSISDSAGKPQRRSIMFGHLVLLVLTILTASTASKPVQSTPSLAVFD